MTTIRMAAGKGTPSGSVKPVPGLVALLAVTATLGLACSGDSGGAEEVTRTTQSAGGAQARIVPVARGLAEPVALAAAPGEPRRMYVVEQRGTIRVIDRGRVRPGFFLDIRRLVLAGGEQGLLGLAFHPRYATNRRFYVHYTNRSGDTRVVEYRSNGTRALTATARRIFSLDDPYSNHNGGHLVFGPDGLLYIGMGDGGSGGDPEDRAQNMSSLFGKLFTIDVDQSGAQPQIVALGLRNPWRYSFDRRTGDLYIADVGQGSIEEIDFTPRSSPGLENYGWDLYEGRSKFEDTPQGPGKLVFPIAQYTHDLGCSVTGGVVYRGRTVRGYAGRYLYGDYCSGIVWSLRVVKGRASGLRREGFQVDGLTGFGEDSAGEVWLAAHGGTIYRLSS
jgi:glucose/arabinose dehydrogenase